MARKKTPATALRDALFTGLTGRPAPDTSSLTGMLTTAFGPGAQGRAVNTAAAARGLGVSAGTVRRWVRAEAAQRTVAPKSETLTALTKAARQAASTKAGRRRSLAAARQAAKDRQVKTKVSVQGRQGMVAKGSTDIRNNRPSYAHLDAEQMNELFDTYEQHGDQATLAYLQDRIDEDYLGGWQIERIDRVELGDGNDYY